jgi:hypothetical protein
MQHFSLFVILSLLLAFQCLAELLLVLLGLKHFRDFWMELGRLDSFVGLIIAWLLRCLIGILFILMGNY